MSQVPPNPGQQPPGQQPYGQPGQQPYGQPAYGQPAYPTPPQRTVNGLAIASLVLSVVNVCGIGGIAGIVTGFMARKQIRESGGSQSGDGLALAGIIVGFIGVALVVLYLIVIVAVGLDSETT